MSLVGIAKKSVCSFSQKQFLDCVCTNKIFATDRYCSVENYICVYIKLCCHYLHVILSEFKCRRVLVGHFCENISLDCRLGAKSCYQHLFGLHYFKVVIIKGLFNSGINRSHKLNTSCTRDFVHVELKFCLFFIFVNTV